MADEIIPVGIKIETTGGEKANSTLDALAAKGPKVQSATDQIAAGSAKAGKAMDGLGASAAGAEKPLQGIAGVTGRLAPAMRALTDQLQSMSGSMGVVKAAAAGFIAEFTVSKFLELRDAYLKNADAVTMLNSQLRLATGSAAGAKQAYGDLLEIANRSRVSFTELGTSYASITRATQDLGISSEKTLRLTETLAKAITISGVSSQSASAAMVQLSQGLSSGTLRGEELNSIMEQTPRVARALAQGLGVGIGALREMGKEGKLTGDVVTEALLKSSETIDREFGKTTATVAEASTVLGNATTNLIGKLDQITGESGKTANAIIRIANALNDVSAAIDTLNLKKLPPQLFGSGEESNLSFGDALSQGSFLGRVASTIARRAIDREGETKKRNLQLDKEATDQMEASQAYFEAASAADKAAEKAQAAVDKFVNASGNLTVAERKNAAQVKVLREFADAVKDYANTSDQYLKARKALDTGLANIEKDFDKKLNPGDNKAAAKAKADAEAYASAIAAGEKRVAMLKAEEEARRPLTALEKAAIEFREREEELVRKSGTSRLAEVQALNAEALARMKNIQAQKDEQAALNSKFTAAIAIEQAREKERDALIGEAEGIEAQVKALREETEAIGLVGTALVNLTNKRTDDLIASLESKKVDASSQGAIDAINRQIRALEALKKEREKSLDKNLLNDANERSKSAIADSAREMKSASDEMYRALTDSLFRAAEAGKGFFRTLRDSIRGMFNNLTIQPALKLAQGAFSNFGVAGGGSDIFGALRSAGSAFTQGMNSLFGKFAMSGTGESLGLSFNPLGEAGATTLTSLGQGIQTALPFLASIAQAANGNYTTAALSAIGTAILPGIGTIIGTVLGMLLEPSPGGPKGGGSFSTTGERLFTPDVSDAQLVRIGQSLVPAITASVAKFGGSAQGLQFGVGFDADPLGTADNRIASFVRNGDQTTFDNTSGRNIGRDPKDIQTELATETKRIMLAALQAAGPTLENGFSDIFSRLDPTDATAESLDQLFALADQLAALGEVAGRLPGVMGSIADLSAVAREKLLGLAGGLDALTGNLQSYYQNFFTAEEQLANAGDNLRTDFAAVGLSFDALVADADGPRQAFRDIVEGMGEVTDSNMDAFAAVVALNPALKDWINAMEAAREAAKQSASSIDNAFLTESDRFFQTFQELGLAIPNTTAEFQNLVRAQDTTTEEGRTLIATLLSVYGGFKAVDQAARDATAALIRQGLESSRNRVVDEMDALTRANGDLSQTLLDLENPIRTTADRFLDLGQTMQEMLDRMADILGEGAVSLLDQLQEAVTRRDSIKTARAGLAETVQGVKIQGFTNRRDFAGGIEFLKGLEKAAFADLATSSDPAGVAGKITSLITTRYQLEADLIASADEARRKALDKEISNLEKLIDIADQLRDTILDLKTGSLSALAPQEQVRVAATNFGAIYNRAQAGDTKALQDLPNAAVQFLTEKQSFEGSGGNYGTVFQNVISSLESVGVSLADAPTQLGLAQSQLDATGLVVDNTDAMAADLATIDSALVTRLNDETSDIADLVTEIRTQIGLMEEERDALRVERQAAQVRWSSLGTSLNSIEDSMRNIANNATFEGAGR